MTEPKYVNLECTSETFRPCLRYPVRWLDVEADYPLARAIWFEPLSLEGWRQFREDGYRYCAVVEEGRIVSMAAAWSYSDTAWEVAAVHTVPEARRRGYGKSVVSFVTAHILELGRLATCLTVSTNLPMQDTAKSVGFYVAPRRS